jgi:hypothetical protein
MPTALTVSLSILGCLLASYCGYGQGSVISGNSYHAHHHHQFRKERTGHAGAQLPVMPATLPELEPLTNGKLIPSKIWIAVKNKDDELASHVKDFFQRNPTWTPIICDNICKDDFINQVWGNTSIQWTYFMINPVVGAARADIWRYCVLYTYGGMYMDDDSNIVNALDTIVGPNDNMILSEEGASSLGPCYDPTYSLQDQYLLKKYPNASAAKYYHKTTAEGNLEFFHGNTLINWAIFVKPRHPVFMHTLEHIVDIVAAEYARRPVLSMSPWDHRWKAIFCATNFVYTYTLRALLLENSLSSEDVPRIETRDFAKYGGKCKYISTAADQSHYSKVRYYRDRDLVRHVKITLIMICR